MCGINLFYYYPPGNLYVLMTLCLFTSRYSLDVFFQDNHVHCSTTSHFILYPWFHSFCTNGSLSPPCTTASPWLGCGRCHWSWASVPLFHIRCFYSPFTFLLPKPSNLCPLLVNWSCDMHVCTFSLVHWYERHRLSPLQYIIQIQLLYKMYGAVSGKQWRGCYAHGSASVPSINWSVGFLGVWPHWSSIKGF